MSQVSICNQALTTLGAKAILNIDEQTTEGKLCKLHYQTTLDSMLESASWSFATKRIKLPLSAQAPQAPWIGKYLIPVDMLRVLECGDEPDFYWENTTNWQVEGKYINTMGENCYVRGLTNDIGDANFTPSFNQAFAARLAADLCLAITQSASLTNSLYQKAGELMQIAITMDSMQGRTRKLRSGKYLNARRSRGGAFFSLNPNYNGG